MTLARLPRDPRPEQLPEGAEVIISRPEWPTAINPAGRRARVISTSWHHPSPTKANPKPDPPRVMVYLQVLTQTIRPGERTWKWADELDLVIN